MRHLSRRHTYAGPFLIGLVLVFSVGILLIVGSGVGAWAEQPGLARDYELTGSFAPTHPSDSEHIGPSEPALWSSYSDQPGATGQLRSPTFKAPRWLGLRWLGYPSQPGITLHLEHQQTQATRRLMATGDAGDQWQQVVWRLPTAWVGVPVRLVVVDDSPDPYGWVGVSTPQPASWFSLFTYASHPIRFWLRYSLHFSLLILPGAIGLSRWRPLEGLSSSLAGLAIFMVTALGGYGAFWVYWLNHLLGTIICSLIMLATVIYTWRGWRDRSLSQFLRQPEVAIPLGLIYLVGLAYLAVLYVYSHPASLTNVTANSRFMPGGGLPPDNVLPYILADKLYHGIDPRPLLGEWQSSDRPPLQAGIVLMQGPLISLLGSTTWGLSYQMISTIAQCSWLAAVWALGQQLRLRSAQLALVLSFCIFSGFFLVNSVYVWPKLLAATLATGLVIALFQGIQAPPRQQFPGILGGLGAGLGMIAHSGVVFTLLPTLVWMLGRIKRLGLRRVGAALILMTLVILPWIGYQKFYEPPGNRLVKWHLAGAVDLDQRSFSQALIENYQALGWQQAIEYKLDNVRQLVGLNVKILPLASYRTPPVYAAERVNEFFCTAVALGGLNVGWLLMAVAGLRRLGGQNQTSSAVNSRLFAPVILALISLVVWCLMIFGPGTTVIHAGSYATMLLLFVGLGAWVATGPRWLAGLVLVGQVGLFFATWILPPPQPFPDALWPGPNLTMIGIAIAATIGIVGQLYALGGRNQLSRH